VPVPTPPLVLSVNPGVAETDVVLGTQIVITFDQAIDVTTLTEDTFSLTGPGVQALTPGQLTPTEPAREYITGTFDFAVDASGRTVLRFNPATPLRKDTEYRVLILGASSSLSADTVKSAGGLAMADSYEWTFKTGALNVVTPPPLPPLPDQIRYLDPKEIIVIPRKAVGNDLAQEIDLIFPEDVDQASVDPTALLIAIEPILGDLGVVVPANLSAVAAVTGRKVTVTITGW
jgi:hypothetical protein